MDGAFPPTMLGDIEHFLNCDKEPRGRDLYEGVFKVNTMFPLQRKRELAKMMALARSVEPRCILEVGADKGGGLYHWCKCLPSVRRVCAIEIRGTPYRHAFERHFPNIDFCWVEGSSYGHKEFETVWRWLGNDSFQCSFLDGDKAAFLADYALYSALTDNLIFVHDVTDPVPGEAFRRIAARRRTEIIHDVSEPPVEKPKTEYDNWLRHWNGASCGVGVVKEGI